MLHSKKPPVASEPDGSSELRFKHNCDLTPAPDFFAGKTEGAECTKLFNRKCVGSTRNNFWKQAEKEHKQEFIKIFLADIKKMYGWGMKLLANKIHIQGMKYCWLTKCINKNHNVMATFHTTIPT